MREVRISAQFKKDAKRYKNSPRVQEKINEAIRILASDATVPVNLREHTLRGIYAGFLECHAAPDLLLIYTKTENVLTLIRVGSHAELF